MVITADSDVVESSVNPGSSPGRTFAETLRLFLASQIAVLSCPIAMQCIRRIERVHIRRDHN